MDYGDFSNPKGGYQDVQSKVKNPNGMACKPDAKDFQMPTYSKKGDFTEKKVYSDGVGNFHVNHFIAYFNYLSPTPNLITSANKVFFKDFPLFFSIKNIADAELSDYEHNGKKTIEFRTGGNMNPLFDFYINPLFVLFPIAIPLFPLPILPIPNISKFSGIFHSDWVSIEMMDDSLSFYGSTLKRNWIEDKEKKLVTTLASKGIANKLIEEKNAFKFAVDFIEVNQHHFLAGRRSWAVGYDKEVNKWYVETMAFERSSQCEYNVIEKTGVLREQIIRLWVLLLLNFEKHSNVKFFEFTQQNFPYEYQQKYCYNNTVAFNSEENKNATTLLAVPWITKALKRHPGLIKGL